MAPAGTRPQAYRLPSPELRFDRDISNGQSQGDDASLISRAKKDPMEAVRAAGLAGAVAYFCVECTFFAIALPMGYLLWHANTGEWLQPLLLLQTGTSEEKARLIGLVVSYVVLLKALFPVRLGATVLATPVIQRLMGKQSD